MSEVGVSASQEPNPVRFLYLKDVKDDGIGIELEAAIKDNAKDIDKFIPGAKDLLEANIGSDLSEMLASFNKRVIGSLNASNKIEVNPVEYPKNGEVLKPEKGDYLGPEAKDSEKNVYVGNGTKLDAWQSFMKLDGKGYPLTVLRGGVVNKIGMPEVMILQTSSEGKMELEPLGEKDGKPFYFYGNVPYIDPNNGQEKKGIYYKIKETTKDGKSVTNGVIVPKELVPHVVVEADEITKDEYDALIKEGKNAFKASQKYFVPKKASFIGVKESQKLIDSSTNVHIDISA